MTAPTPGGMTVAALMKELAAMPADALVVMAKDAEGNNFSPLAEIGDEAHYIAESTWAGYLRDDEYDPDEDGPDGAVPCVVLWPTN